MHTCRRTLDVLHALFTKSIYRGIQIAKPNAVHSRPVLNRQVLLLLDRFDLSSHHMQVGTRASTASPSHHMTVRLTSSAAISLYSPWPAALAFRRSVSPSDSSPLSARAQLMARFFGYLAARGKSGDSKSPALQARRVGGVVRRRERCCAFLGLFHTREPISTKSHATPHLGVLSLVWIASSSSSSASSLCYGERDVPCHPVATRRS
jgi:hypothetical protein